MSDGRLTALVMGIGNILWADEGFGVRCVEELDRRYVMAPDVTVMDGGTQGLFLVNYVAAADRLLVFDAVDYGEEPGTIKVVRGDEVPKFTGCKKMSLHQTGFQDVLSAADLMGSYPRELTLIGVQAAELEDFGGGLTEIVAGRLDACLEIALRELADWGLAARPRTAQDGPPDLVDRALSWTAYEQGRPSAELACRIGDERFL